MNKELTARMIGICKDKIASKGDKVGLSFYAFFSNQNNQPKVLLEVAEWWIMTHQLDHFEKAVKVIDLLEDDNNRRKK